MSATTFKSKSEDRSADKLAYPEGYKPYLDLKDTEKAIRYIKTEFQNALADALNLSRVSAPLFVRSETGVNDHLSGVESPVSFHVKEMGVQAEIVQSLAKWKRMALADYHFEKGEGLYTDMNAIRPDEVPDNLHSFYVDQWDWERIIDEKERSLDFLKSIVRKIYNVIVTVEREVHELFPALPKPALPEEITFIHSEELQERYPTLSPSEREDTICKEKGAVFIIGIGAALADDIAHDHRAADYDDWITETVEGKKGLNGDIVVWYPTLEQAFELSSMGIRVDAISLIKQLEIKDELAKASLYWHKRLLDGDLPLTIGGGIGQSRLCMFMLRKAHIGEVQSSIWPEGMIDRCKTKGITLL